MWYYCILVLVQKDSLHGRFYPSLQRKVAVNQKWAIMQGSLNSSVLSIRVLEESIVMNLHDDSFSFTIFLNSFRSHTRALSLPYIPYFAGNVLFHYFNVCNKTLLDYSLSGNWAIIIAAKCIKMSHNLDSCNGVF